GFAAHGYDLVIAANVLHATRDIEASLGHCRRLLAPSGILVALEGLKPQGWLDLTFGLLEGWWCFEDRWRADHALMGASSWRSVLSVSGFHGAAVIAADGAMVEDTSQGVIVAQAPSVVEEPHGLWLVLAPGDDGRALATGLAARNQQVIWVDPAGEVAEEPLAPGVRQAFAEPARRDAWRALIAALPEDMRLDGVVHGEAIGAAGAELWPDAERLTASALALSQALQEAGQSPRKGVSFLTRQAIVTGHEPAPGLSGAPLWGFARSLAQEVPQLAPRLIDLDARSAVEGGEPLPPSLINILLDPDKETETAFRNNIRLANRLASASKSSMLSLPQGSHWQLVRGDDGLIDSLQARSVMPRELGPGEVRVRVEATALNFRDVLIALGASLGNSHGLGCEFCGRVIGCGPDVHAVQLGDLVLGLGVGTFAPETVTLADFVTLAPAGYTAAALTTLPSTSVTVELAFRLAGLRAGDRVLVHAGAGGVGLAAIALARALGAEVIATASDGKRGFLRNLGVEHVFDSRTTSFAREVLSATGGVGVDVVLNSLTGVGFIEASLSCLARRGRFIEIGKRDIWTRERMALSREDVDYHILAVDALMVDAPGMVRDALRTVVERLEKGEISPLPFNAYPLSEISEAMRFMASGRHVGKIVLTPPRSPRLRPDRTVLVTGGFGGIGLKVASWLAEHEVGTIVLNGRREPDEEALAEICRLRAGGVRIEVMLADVTDSEAVGAMLARIDATLPPLGGVIHSVGIMSDAALANQDRRRFEQVLAPKVKGAWHLHEATLGLDLDLFVLFSSAAGVLGNAGQTNHAAANAFLDQLALHRRSLGLVGQAMAWGPWSGLGEAEEQRGRIGSRFSATGFDWITPQVGMQAFDALIHANRPATVIIPADWTVLARQFENLPMRFSGLVASADVSVPAAHIHLADKIKGASDHQRRSLLISFLQGELQAVLGLGLPPDPTIGFFELGMDSLMAVELRNRLEKAFGSAVELPNTLAFDYPSLNKLADYIHDNFRMAKSGVAKVGVKNPTPRSVVRADDDAVAVIGLAGRFPGADDVEAYWQLLLNDVHAISEIPKERWDVDAYYDPDPEVSGKMVTRHGGFMEGVDRFDAEFFRIAPVEARLLDPQQRILLETAWTALEHAGYNPSGLAGSRTGVYIGFSGSDYRELMASTAASDVMSIYAATGSAGSTAIGRISFALGLEGPAIAVDTACSSSLVAVDQACDAIRQGKVELALAGGVNMLLSPSGFILFSNGRMLSPDGLCKTFDASADG
ncbi:MAG: SDR family NAD(P)-dependent oxidoreductase, partial [Aestuariivirga sp.]|uniref:SDR family NAD(P)-dependent oxidoreductase n=1 Tax=Aestuariivirga sp. TaxID=2650926 RepID=UPI00301AB18D